MPHSIWVVELNCASLFIVDFAFRGVYLAASRRREYLLSPTTLVYLVNILPVLPASFFIRYQLSHFLLLILIFHLSII